MATKTINVKVSTAKVVKALETALAEKKKVISDFEKAKEQHKKDFADFEKNLVDMFRKGKGKVIRVSQMWRHEDNTKYEFSIEFPSNMKEPQAPETPNNFWSVNSDIEELENAIALLKMTDEETISASTYKGVAKFVR